MCVLNQYGQTKLTQWSIGYKFYAKPGGSVRSDAETNYAVCQFYNIILGNAYRYAPMDMFSWEYIKLLDVF